MKHFFQKGNDPLLLLLHGTGGTERDLLPVAELIDDTASILSVRGNVDENGKARFFRRVAEGVFDEEDLIYRTKELNAFLDSTSELHQFDRKNIVAIGYSNGANIASSLLFHYKEALKGAILFHPMVPRRGIELPKLDKIPIFIGAGKNDPICNSDETTELAKTLQNAGAKVDIHWEDHGHQLTQSEVSKASDWYDKIFL